MAAWSTPTTAGSASAAASAATRSRPSAADIAGSSAGDAVLSAHHGILPRRRARRWASAACDGPWLAAGPIRPGIRQALRRRRLRRRQCCRRGASDRRGRDQHGDPVGTASGDCAHDEPQHPGDRRRSGVCGRCLFTRMARSLRSAHPSVGNSRQRRNATIGVGTPTACRARTGPVDARRPLERQGGASSPSRPRRDARTPLIRPPSSRCKNGLNRLWRAARTAEIDRGARRGERKLGRTVEPFSLSRRVGPSAARPCAAGGGCERDLRTHTKQTFPMRKTGTSRLRSSCRSRLELLIFSRPKPSGMCLENAKWPLRSHCSPSVV